MADDDTTNKSKNRSTPNGIDDGGLYTGIQKIGRQYQSKGVLDAQQRQRLAQASEQIGGLEDLIEDRPELRKSKTIMNSLENERETIKRLSPRVALRRETHRERALGATNSLVEREFDEKHIHGQMQRLGQTSTMQLRGLSMSGRPQNELERERSSVFGQIGGIHERVRGIVENELYDKEGRQDEGALSRIRAAHREKKLLINRAASYDVALQKKRDDGSDDKSLDRNLLEVGRRAQNTLFKSQVADELRSGQGMGSMTVPQLKEKEIEQARGLAEALEKLKNSAGESAETINKMREEANKAADGLKETQEAIKQGGGANASGGGLGRALMGMAPALMNTAAAAAQEVLINQPMQTLQSRLGYAQLSNAQYAQRGAALGGDMASLLTATQGVGNTMSATGEAFGGNTQVIRGVNASAGAITAGLGAMEITSGVRNNANIAGWGLGTSKFGEISSGIKTLAEGAAQTVVAGGDLINKSSYSSAKLGGESVAYQHTQAVNAVRGDFTQSFYDYSAGTRQAALAAGGRGGRRITNQFAADSGGPGGLLDRLREARIAPNEYARMAGEGAANQGSVFDTNQIFQARNLERSGVGTADQNMQRMGQLAGAGANNPQAAFASVLEVAFSKSLDSSKALSMLNQNTAEMARGSVGASMLGLDTTGTSARILGGLTASTDMMPNREMAADRARTAAERINEMSTGIGANFTDMLGVARIAKASGADTASSTALKKMDVQSRLALKQEAEALALDPNNTELQSKLQDRVASANLYRGFVDKNGKVDTGRLIKGVDAATAAGIASQGGFINQIDPNAVGYKEMVEGKLSYEQMMSDPTKYNKLIGGLSATGISTSLSPREIMAGLNPTINSVNETGQGEANKAQVGKGGSEALRDIDTAVTTGFAEAAKKAGIAANQLGGAAEAMGKINTAMQSLADKLNRSTADKFQDAAGDAGDGLKSSAKTFFEASGNFQTAVTEFKGIPADIQKSLKDTTNAMIDKIKTIIPGSSDDGRTKNGVK